MEQKEMNLDQFGEVMDKFITENEISMLITMPKGTQEPEIKSNVENLGPVCHLYFLLAAMGATIEDMIEVFDAVEPGTFDREQFVDDMLDMIRENLQKDKTAKLFEQEGGTTCD